MTAKQPEALRLAARLDPVYSYRTPLPDLRQEAAAELRRLHAEVERITVIADDLQALCDRQAIRIAKLEEILYGGSGQGITLPRFLIEGSLEALEALLPDTDDANHDGYDGRDVRNWRNMAATLRAALEQSDTGIPASEQDDWKLVPVEPTQEMLAAACRDGADLNGRPVWKHTVDVQAAWRWGQMLAAAPQPPVVKQPQLVEMLGETCIDGGKCHHKCTDRCFRRECCAPFSDYSGPWKYEQTQPQGEQEPVGKLISDPYEGHIFVPYGDRWPFNEDLYTRPQPKREPLTRQQIQNIVMEVCDTIYPQDHTSYSEADSVFYGAFVNAIERAHGIGSRS